MLRKEADGDPKFSAGSRDALGILILVLMPIPTIAQVPLPALARRERRSHTLCNTVGTIGEVAVEWYRRK